MASEVNYEEMKRNILGGGGGVRGVQHFQAAQRCAMVPPPASRFVPPMAMFSQPAGPFQNRSRSMGPIRDQQSRMLAASTIMSDASTTCESLEPIKLKYSGTDSSSESDEKSIKPRAMELSKVEVQKVPKQRDEVAATVELLIKQLTELQVRELLDRVVENQAGMVLDTLRLMGNVAVPGSAMVGQPGPLPQDPAGQPSWCTCKNCRTMQTAEENVCCGHAPELCLAQMQDMEMKLQPFLLELQKRHQIKKQTLNTGKDETETKMDETKTDEIESDHATKREAAYRMFAYWWRGTLGAGNTVVIPSCVVLHVRAKYPDKHNNYTQDSSCIVLFDKKMFEK